MIFLYSIIVQQCNSSLFDCYRDTETVEELVEKNGLSILSSRDEWGYTPAHWAALDGNVEVGERYFLDDDDETSTNIILVK